MNAFVIKHRKALYLTLAAVVVAAAIGSVFYYLSNTSAVPRLVGTPVESADDAIQAAGFVPGEVTYTDIESVTPGLVESQALASGTRTWRGTRVDVIVAGFKPVRVPKLTGLSALDAKALVSRADLAWGKTVFEYSNMAPGTVMDASPTAGTLVQPGQPVDLVVAKPSKTRVPNVVGKHVDDADAALTKAGFTSSIAGRRPVSIVLSQTPRAGDMADPGSSITLRAREVRPKASNLWTAREGDTIYVPVVRSTAKFDDDPEDLMGNHLDFDGLSFKFGGEAFVTEGITRYTAHLKIYLPLGVPRGTVGFGDTISLRVDEFSPGSNGGSLRCTFLDVWK